MTVPHTPFWEAWLFESPWVLVGLMAIAAGGLGVVANRNADKRLWAAAGVAALLGLGVYAVSHVVQTQREAVADRVASVLDSTAPFDETAFMSHFTEHAVLTGPTGEMWANRLALELFFVDEIQPDTIHTQEVSELLVGQQAGVADEVIAMLTVKTRLNVGGLDTAGLPHETKWGMVWRQNAQGQWQIQELRWLEYEGESPGGLGRWRGLSGGFDF